MRHRATITDKTVELVNYLHERKVPKEKIAEIAGISPKSVYRITSGSRERENQYFRQRNALVRQKAEQKLETAQTEAVQTVIETQIETQTETKAETVAQSNTISDEALYNVMKNAVLDAMNQALAQNMSNLRGMVLGAIRTSQM